ncbi:Vps52-domain-containing protein [Exidia glandulosa HHB12029]|uniref:Vps52-domain-containing protein n=1 Tax=Exidia glandulosa HHB12029 TaxID=1314781 RepID=A0A165QV89_EXIGL|nr:Vps52-domain-containing protein [Exidia glandulosa HHB12029]
MSNFVELHNKVSDSLSLLDNLQAFLSTFQSDLSHVSGQISNLQERSKDIDSRLKGRRKIEKPLANLLSDLCIPPDHAVLILDTDVSEEWIPVIGDLERQLDALKARPKVKAARDIAEVAEGLRIAAASKIRALFLALLQPIRSNMSTNIHVLQTSVLLKYQPLFAFLQRQAAPVALEVQRAYAGAARVYYETGFRRYARTLSQVLARFPEKADFIANATVPISLDGKGASLVDVERLTNATINGPAVTLAYQADDKNFREHVEGLFRSLHLVLLDNATAEYSFILAFFTATRSPSAPSFPASRRESATTLEPSPFSPSVPFSPLEETMSDIGGITPTARRFSINLHELARQNKEEKTALDALWKSVLDPAVEYCQNFVKTALAGPPTVIALLSMIRLNEAVLSEVQTRGGCAPLETYLIGLRLAMWPVFQNQMNAHHDGLKKLADSAAGGLLSRGAVKDATVQAVAQRFCAMFLSFVSLAGDEADEAMVFSQMLRLRQEVIRLITTQSTKLKDPAQAASYQSTVFETVLQALTVRVKRSMQQFVG